MSYIATPAEERGVDAASEAGAEFDLFRDGVEREELVSLVRYVLDAATTVDHMAEDMAKRSASYLWDPAHRDDVLRYVHPDGMPEAAANVDRSIEQGRRIEIRNQRDFALRVREILLGDNA